MNERGKSYEGARPSSSSPQPPAGERRVALVIGNGGYQKPGCFLHNPPQDARDIAAALSRLGFDLIPSVTKPDQSWHDDVDLNTFGTVLSRFAVASHSADMAVMYYAGHGIEVDGTNYLIPTSADLGHVSSLQFETRSLPDVLRALQGAKTLRLLILDACRNNPFGINMIGLPAGRSVGMSLTQPEPPGNTIVFYAARHGTTANDGVEGGNSPFATALLRHLETPDLELLHMFGEVADDVRELTANGQEPYLYGTKGRHLIYLKRSQSAAAEPISQDTAAEGATGPLEWSQTQWELLKGSTNIARLQRFADHAHPYYAGEAIDRIAVLEAEQQRDREAAERTREEAQAETDRYPAEGRIYIDAPIVDSLTGNWFLPGDGNRAYFKDLDVGPEMVVVPADRFTMGSPKDEPEREGDENPQHDVAIIDPFAVSRFAITFDEWDAYVADAGGKAHTPTDAGWGRGRRPVINVSWDDAQAYISWLSEKTRRPYRLLTEAEWEYVARAGTKTRFWWGEAIAPEQANYDGNYTYAGGSKGEYREKTVPVDSFAANPWGLYNVHGNVWEWCEDTWHDKYKGAPSDGSAWLQGGEESRRVVRGGSWGYSPRNLRSAIRSWFTAGYRYSDVGFRLARTLNP